MRRLNFVLFNTPFERDVVDDAFDRGGFFDLSPEMCYMRSGVFMLWDPDRRSYVVVVCRNNNDLNVWQ